MEFVDRLLAGYWQRSDHGCPRIGMVGQDLGRWGAEDAWRRAGTKEAAQPSGERPKSREETPTWACARRHVGGMTPTHDGSEAGRHAAAVNNDQPRPLTDT
jgi:hypothetical protein